MYSELQKELELFQRRTPKSAEAHKRNLKRIPLGVASNYRAYDPYPIFVKDAQGRQLRNTVDELAERSLSAESASRKQSKLIEDLKYEIDELKEITRGYGTRKGR